MRAPLCFAMLASSVAACSFLVDTTGLSGLPGDAGAGGGPGEAGGGVEAGHADAAPADAATLPGPDGAPPGAGVDAGGSRYCDTLAPRAGFRFCSDFDGRGEDGSVGAEWGDLRIGLGGTLSFDAARFVSAPRALHATTTTGDNTFVVADAPVATRQLKATFEFNLVAPDTHGGAVCMFAVQQLGAPYSSVFIYVNGPNIYGQTNGNANVQFSSYGAAPAPGTWHQMTLVLDQLNGKITMTYDATRLFDDVTNAHPWNTTDPSKIYAGLPFLYQVTAADVLVDDVVVEAD